MAEPTNPLNEFRPFNEETLEDALVPIRERFGEDACELARWHLRNPLCRECNDMGTVGYRKGKPVCFQVACIRRLFWKQQEIFGVVGGLTCRTKKGCPPSVTFETIERAEAPRMGSVMNFGNSCCSATAMIDEEKGAGVGPVSCTRSLWAIIHPMQSLAYAIRRKILKQKIPAWPDFNSLGSCGFCVSRRGVEVRRVMSFEPTFFDRLQREHLKNNEGLFCSRTAEELDWVFGDRVASGRCVVLGASRQSKPCGYVVLRLDSFRRRCEIMDLFALDCNERIVRDLIAAAKKYLYRHTPIMALEVFGFPSFIQPLLKRMLPFEQGKGLNKFSWSVQDCPFREELLKSIDSPKSWFFGPYDGDYCFD